MENYSCNGKDGQIMFGIYLGRAGTINLTHFLKAGFTREDIEAI